LLEQLGVEPARLDGIAASGLADLVVEFAGGVDQGIDWRASYHLSAGRIACDQLPRVLSQISVRGTATPQQLMVQRASALFGKSRIDAALHAIDWQANGQFAVQAKAQQLVVDHNLRELLPQSVRCLWDRFRPEGEVNLAAAFRLDSLGLAPQQVVVECKNASFEDAEKFPYRVERAAGQLVYTAAGDEGRLEISLEGLAANQPVSLRGELSGLPSGCNFIGESKSPAPPRGMPPGWISIDCPRIPIHKRLLDALPSRSQATVQSLDPHGEISVAWRVERVAGSAVIDTSTDIELHNCSVRYSKFPYPLSGMTGHLHERNGEWTIENVESRANAQGAVVQWQGTCKTHDDQLLVRLEVAGTNMPLDDQLRVAMPERLQPLWSQFRPAGRVNFRANVVFASDHPEPVISLAVRPSERSVSIRPAFFDYSLEQIDGIVTLHQGVVTLRDMRATHGSTSISTNGTWRANDRAGWRLDLTKLSVDRLTPSRDLVSAAPQGIRQIIEQINPEGGFAIHDGTLMFEQPSQGSTQFVSQWDLKLDCHQSHFDVGVKLENVSGMVRLAGRSDQAGSYSDGQLMLDSAFWQGIQVTNIRGPLRAERNRTLLGQGAGKVTGQTPRRIEADLSGGKLALDAVVWHDGRTRYNVASSMTGVDLKRLMHEQLEASTDVSGKLQAELTLGGVGSSLDLLQGSGTVKVTEAQIYELPVFVSLLKVLRNRTPDTTAFDACEAAFTITGQQIEFSQLNLMGDAVSLYGRGQASFDHDIDLVFHSIMGRHDWNVPMLRSVLGTASQQILQIEVDGTLEQPITHRRALPAVSSLIEHLGGDGLNPSNPEHAAKRDAKGAMQR
jgi:hypothetical protein